MFDSPLSKGIPLPLYCEQFFWLTATFWKTYFVQPMVLQIVKFVFLALSGEVIASVFAGVAACGTHI